jgi:hypothetical protein
MVVMTPREKWTDERLDDLNKKVDDGFTKMEARFDKMESRFDRIEASFQGLYRVLLGGAITVVAALIGVNAF